MILWCLKEHWFLVQLSKLQIKVARQENLSHLLGETFKYKVKPQICSLELVKISFRVHLNLGHCQLEE